MGFGEYLRRVLSHRARLAEPCDLAELLASHARDALARVEAAEAESSDETSPLATVRAALEEALGVQLKGERGARFLRSTLVQTLFSLTRKMSLSALLEIGMTPQEIESLIRRYNANIKDLAAANRTYRQRQQAALKHLPDEGDLRYSHIMASYWENLNVTQVHAALTHVHDARAEVRRLQAEAEGLRECLKAQGLDQIIQPPPSS